MEFENPYIFLERNPLKHVRDLRVMAFHADMKHCRLDSTLRYFMAESRADTFKVTLFCTFDQLDAVFITGCFALRNG